MIGLASGVCSGVVARLTTERQRQRRLRRRPLLLRSDNTRVLLAALARLAESASSQTTTTSADENDDDFSWRLHEGGNVHVNRHHKRVTATGSGAGAGASTSRPPPPRDSIMDLDAVERFAKRHDVKKTSLQKVYRELFRRGKSEFTAAQDVGVRDMKLLSDNFAVTTSEVIEHKVTSDGTGAKMVVRLHDGALVETVVIGHQHASSGTQRNTVCVSTQVGCRMGCTFCETGTLGLLANLTAGEILEQVWHARNLVGAEGVRNVVFMGMGEPLDNYEEVLVALRAMTHQSMFNLRQSAVTVSTVGIPARIRQLADDAPKVNLALSLHAPTQGLRAALLPSAAGTEHTLSRLSSSLRYHRRATGRGAMIEYIVIDGVNDSEEHARALGRMVACELTKTTEKGSDVGRVVVESNAETMATMGSVEMSDFSAAAARQASSSSSNSSNSSSSFPPSAAFCASGGYYVNLIPYNPTQVGTSHGYQTPTDAALTRMQDIVSGEFGVKCKVRWSTAKGRQIDGACGQLALKSMSPQTPRKADKLSRWSKADYQTS